MAVLLDQQPIAVSSAARRVSTVPVAIDPQTESITVWFTRPTTIAPGNWPASATIRASIVLTTDGREHRCRAEYAGGIIVDPSGRERAKSTLAYFPTVGFFDGLTQKRLGETVGAYTAHLEVELLTGAVETVVSVTTTTAPAPTDLRHSSVAYQNSTVGAGSGTSLSFSHTASGTDLGVWVHTGSLETAPSAPASSVTYAGVALTEIVDDAHSSSTLQHAAYYGTENTHTLSGTQTVAATFTNDTDSNAMGVISMTGVHQTTPVGTHAHAVAFGAAADVTVGSVGADDLVVDGITVGGSIPSVGADQTSRHNQLLQTNVYLAGSTQLGSLGGVMQWTAVTYDTHAHNGVAFKPAAAATLFPPWRPRIQVMV